MRASSNIISSIVSSEPAWPGGPALLLKPSPRARMMRLRLDPRTGGVVLSFPRRMSQRRALAWAAGQREWVERALRAAPVPVRLGDGAALPLRGEPHRILWQEAASRRIVAADGMVQVGGPAELVEGRVLRWLRREAADALALATHHYAARAGVSVERVGVGDPISRWGSCSSAGAIRYSWRLILAPEWVLRATAAHEVAHRVHMNHGPDFHALVAELLEEDPAVASAWLRRHGAELHRYGR